MKKLFFVLAVLFALFALQTQTALFAQVNEDNDVVVFNAHLLETFDVTVVNGNTQEITFAVAADYNNGVINGLGILPGTSEVTVEATDIWNLTIEAPDFVPGGGNPGTGTIPIENLGVYCDDPGTHKFGVEVTCLFTTPATIHPLTNAAVVLIDNGSGNGGDASDNDFILTWEMGTPNIIANQVPPPGIGTMFDQMANGDFTTGDYTTTAILTLWSL